MARPVNSIWEETRWRNAIESDDLYLLGAQAGWTRRMVDEWTAQQGGYLSNVNRTKYFATTVLPGYEQYREHARQFGERPISPATWLRTPSFKREQLSTGLPLTA